MSGEGAVPIRRCKFCTAPPLEEVAVAIWVDNPDDVRRETIHLCRKHLARLRKAGDAGHAHKGLRYRAGFW